MRRPRKRQFQYVLGCLRIYFEAFGIVLISILINLMLCVHSVDGWQIRVVHAICLIMMFYMRTFHTLIHISVTYNINNNF